MGVTVMGMMIVMMQVVRHAGLRPVEWREYNTRTESGNYARSTYSPVYLFTGKPELYRTSHE